MLASLWVRAARIPARGSSRVTVARGAVGQLSARRWTSATALAQESSEEPTIRPEQTAAKDTDTPDFSTLKDAISRDTLNAIVGEPFKLTRMTSVQAAVLPLLPGLSEPHSPDSEHARDLLVRARTGTGKTLAFLVPAIEARIRAVKAAGDQAVADAGAGADQYTQERAMRRYARAVPGCLVISPTRELATQIANEALRLSSHHRGFEVRLFVGGASKGKQLRDWHKGRLDIVVGTPGRIRDMLENEPDVSEGLAQAKVLILDEADTLLDMGFRDDLDGIVSKLQPTPERQTFMFSATVSPQIRQIARTYLDNSHKYINCVDDSAPPTHASIPQYHTVLPTEADQLPHLLRLLAHDQLLHGSKSKTLIFTPTTKMTQLFTTLVRSLSSSLPAGIVITKVFEIHSKLSQMQRDKAAASFREVASKPTILVTSDVSARGVDYPGITRVIQIGIPSSTETYVHRAGRTGRGKDMIGGRVDLVLMPWEVGYVSWKLADMPLKPQTTGELEKQVRELAQRLDSGEHSVSIKGAQSPYLPVFEAIQKDIEQLQTRLDEDAVSGVMFSLFGYYGTHVGDLRVQRNVVIEGLKNWATEAMGLEEPPYISRDVLTKTGFGSTPQKSMRENRRSEPQNWLGRGRVANRESRGYDKESRGYDKESRGYDRAPRSFDRPKESRGYDRPREPRSFDKGSRGYDRDSRSNSLDRPRRRSFDSESD